jgi:hypothetical protein
LLITYYWTQILSLIALFLANQIALHAIDFKMNILKTKAFVWCKLLDANNMMKEGKYALFYW